jgi:hypothetical protein
MRKKVCLVMLFSLATIVMHAQNVMAFDQAAKLGKSYEYLDKLYKSAVHSDAELAVFKTADEQQSLQKAYINFITDLGGYLRANNFTWDRQTHCFNRIYFAKNGKVDYFLYNFSSGEISVEKEKEFVRLLSMFLDDHTFGLTAGEPFAQCSPIKYKD